jgi:hypothetical protein
MAAGEDAGAKLDLIAQAIEDEQPTWYKLGEGRYRWVVPSARSTFEVDYLRRERGVLHGEVLVRCDLPGAVRAVDDVLAVDNINLAASRTRKAFGQYLAERAKTEEIDYVGLLEELAQRVMAGEREGDPAVWLNQVPLPPPEQSIDIDGFPLLAKNPLILFGDGGTAKSYLALWLAGRMANDGLSVGYFDWELNQSDHRARLGELFGEKLPWIAYARCSQPLVQQADRLRRIVRDKGLEFVVFDSVGFACDGPPEAAEVANRYFQALRGMGEIGSLHVAHITKGETGDQKPFGSVFWHNGARSTWNVKRSDPGPDSSLAQVALHNRKANLGPLRASVGFELLFGRGQTTVRRADLATVPDLAVGLPVGERLRLALRSGPLTRDELKAELDGVRDSSLRMAIKRARDAGVVLEFGDRLSLAERRY